MPVQVSDSYDELMHYTTMSGLEGILSSSCLWASDANFLNDAREISHYFAVRLSPVLEPVVRKFTYDQAQEPKKLAWIISNGGFDSLIAGETAALLTSIRDVTLRMNRPFVLSLCGAADSRVRQSGLLSQWRGYGKDGGYALVFDSKGIEAALDKEAKSFAYLHVQIGDVFYEGIDPASQPAKNDFEEMESAVREGAARLLYDRRLPEESAAFYQAVTGLSCLFKHWGFWEEREVRVVAIPAPSSLMTEDIEPKLPQKRIKTFRRGDVEVPYIELFSNESDTPKQEKLPLKRVIIGPHRDSSSRVAQVVELLHSNGYDAEVVESEIPYMGQ